MEAGKDDEEETVAPQGGEEIVAQPGSPSGDVAAATGEQGVTPIPEEETAAQEGPEKETAAQEGPEEETAAPEGPEKEIAAPESPGEEAPAGETAATGSAALPADVAALLNSPGMVETLQRMVAEATAKAQAKEAKKLAELEQAREKAERLVDRQAR